jgi:hypothetical protein
MSGKGVINLADIPPGVRKRMNLPKLPRQRTGMAKDAVRTAAIRVMAVVADLTPAERKRVLAHALKLNEV